MTDDSRGRSDGLSVSLQTSNVGWSRFFKELFRRPTAPVGLTILLGWVAASTLLPFWLAHDATFIDVAHRLRPPAPDHLFGTDELGRDVFTRVLYGGRISVPLSVLVVLLTAMVGTAVGTIAGFFGGWIDNFVMRIADTTLAFPTIVLAMALTAALGAGLQNVVVALTAVWWPEYARLIRGQVLVINGKLYIQSARVVGVGDRDLIWRHVLPNAIGPVLIQATMDVGRAIILIAGLSFIGLGAIPPTPEWGAMISQARVHFPEWWLATFPGLAITSVAIGFSLLGDALRDTLDPRFRIS